MPMRQRALNLEGDCHVPSTRRLRPEARPLRVARSRGEPEGTEVGVRRRGRGTSSANPPATLRCQPETTRISGPDLSSHKVAGRPVHQQSEGGAMPKSSRYSMTELPGTLQRSCREEQETFLSALDDAVRTYGEGDQAHRVA